MGGSESTPQTEKPAPPPPSPEFDKPWRDTPWDNKELLEKNLRELKLSDSKVKYIRILLAGEVGAGKSSFINSVNSVFQRRITTEALVDNAGVDGTSFTRKYRTYYIRNGPSVLPFVFNDIMGLEFGESHGAHPDDIIKALEGLLKEGHNFNPVASAKKDDCKSETNPEDLTYCLVYVIAANKISMMTNEVIKKMRYIRDKASSLGIPQVIIMTMVDEACPLVRKDLRKIYTSKKIKEKMEICSNSVGVPMSHIYPVKNYHEESDTQNDIDVLTLRALTRIVEIADDLLIKRKREFDEAWRDTLWDKKDLLEKNLREFKLSDPKVKYIRILLAGEVGAGKSSFINSVNSAFKRRITTDALADNAGGSGMSFTRTYRTYYIRNGPSVLPFVFNDTMGLEPGQSCGARPDHIIKALEGLLKEEHTFNPIDSTKNDDCKSETNPEDLTYCLVYIIAADKVSMMNHAVFRKIRYIRDKASSLGIPQVIIMTRVDEVCPLVRKDLRKIYTSMKIKEKMEICSNSVGVPMSHIYPVKNYYEEMDTQNDIDVLILRALTQIVEIADDMLNKRKSDPKKC